MGKNKGRKQYQNKRIQKKQYTAPVEKRTQEEIDREFAERYGQGGVIKNVLKIWRDSSRATFITYFPVILFELIYCVVWFVISIFAFIPGTRNFGLTGRDVIVFANAVIVSVGMPLLLSYLHVRYNFANKRYYFFNAVKYILPACTVYLLLDFINSFIAVMFAENRGEAVLAKLETSLYMAIVMVAAIAIFGCIAQIALMIKKNRDEPLAVKLAVGTKHNRDDDVQ